MLPGDFTEQSEEVWPENWPAAALFMELVTQWRLGFGGAIGLDYNVLFARMDRMRLGELEHQQLFDDIRVLEAQALVVMRESDQRR